MGYAQKGPSRAAPATTAHGKQGPARADHGVPRNDGRNTTRPPADRDNAGAKHQKPGNASGVSASGPKIQRAAPVISGNPNAGRHQFRGDGPAPATTSHGKDPVRGASGGVAVSPDNSHQRSAPFPQGWVGSGAPNTGRGSADPQIKNAKRGRRQPLAGPGDYKEYAPA